MTNANFWKSLLHSMYFLIGGFFILMPLSFVLALIVTSKLKWKKLFKTAYFMPIMLSSTAVALIWVYMLNPQYGAINKILEIIGCGSLAKDWLATPNVNVWSAVLVNEWMYAGYNMLIFAAGLVSIPSDLYEAAWRYPKEKSSVVKAYKNYNKWVTNKTDLSWFDSTIPGNVDGSELY